MVEWQGTETQCQWRSPCRIITLDEYNAENVGNAQAETSPAPAIEEESLELPAETNILEVPTLAAEIPVDLLGNAIPAPIAPSRQLSLFDKTEFTRTPHSCPAVILRENGEQSFGRIEFPKSKEKLTFKAHATGKKFLIPSKFCNVTWAGTAAVITIPESELSRRVSLYGMFASCCLF
jgi:hypothetical protein